MPLTRAARTLLLPLPRLAPVYFGVLWVLTFGFGFAIDAIPGALNAQLAVDRMLNDASSPVLDTIARVFDRLDSIPVVASFIVVLVIVVGLTSSWWRGIAAAFVAGGGWLLCLVPKAVIAEGRPPADAVVHALVQAEATLSYPSGHVVFAVTFTVAVVLVARRGAVRAVALALGVLFVLVTAYTRLYLGVHYPTDVVGSLLAGLAGALTVAWLWNVIAPRVVGPLLRRTIADEPTSSAAQSPEPSQASATTS